MQSATPALNDTSRLAPAAAPSKSPVVIDPALLRQVAGGAPKGGWELDGPIVYIDSADAPKGGW
jgi:hypothetical protein